MKTLQVDALQNVPQNGFVQGAVGSNRASTQDGGRRVTRCSSPERRRLRHGIYALLGGFGVIGIGCGYSVRPMYPTEVRTVYVPMSQSNDFRRNLEFRLTESIVKEIEEKTPYKVVNHPQADTVLETRIVALSKRPLNETRTDEPRKLELNLVAEVTWKDVRNGVVLRGPEHVPLPSALQQVASTANFVPEVGQSFATASQEAIDNMAEQIVAMMEEPW